MKNKSKNRIQTLVDLVETNIVYDLYCDHAKVGLKLYKRGHYVYLNDQSIHVYRNFFEIVEKTSNVEFIHSKAQEIIPLENSTLIMAGVGAHCIIDCLKNWKKSLTDSQFSSLSFIICAHYHSLELRAYLQSIGMGQEVCEIVSEKGQFYEVLKLSAKADQKIALFDQTFWQAQSGENLEFIRRIAKNLSLKRDISNIERGVLEQIEVILTRNN